MERARTVAEKWLRELGAQSINELEKDTALPFSVRSTNKTQICEKEYNDNAGVAAAVRCLGAEHTMLLDALTWTTPPLTVRIKSIDQIAPRKLKQSVMDVRSEEWLATTVVTGDGVSYSIVLIVHLNNGAFRVRTMAFDASFFG